MSAVAHEIVFWLGAAAGVGQFQIIRPYSIRTKKIAVKVKHGSIGEMLEQAARLGREQADIGSGIPEMIVADVETTAAIVEYVLKSVGRDFFFHNSSTLARVVRLWNVGVEMGGRGVDQPARFVSRFPTLPPTWA